MKTSICFLLSFNAHLWVVLVASMLPDPVLPEALEISLVRLPAPVEGAESTASAEAVALAKHGWPAPARPEADQARTVQKKNPLPQKQPIENTTTVGPDERAKDEPQKLARVESRETPARQQGKPAAPLPRVVMRVTKRPPTELLAVARETARDAPLPASTATMTVAAVQTAPAPLDIRLPRQAARPQPACKIEADGIFSPGSIENGGDTRPLLDIIQARIDAVTPLVHRTAGSCKFRRGVAWVRFRMNRDGYHEDHRLLRTSGHSCLDERIEEVLHLAEPYPFLAGWIPVHVKFNYGAGR